MNPTNQIDYPNNQPNKDDIFEQLIKKIRSLQLMIDKNKQAWQYLLYGATVFLLGIILIMVNK